MNTGNESEQIRKTIPDYKKNTRRERERREYTVSKRKRARDVHEYQHTVYTSIRVIHMHVGLS